MNMNFIDVPGWIVQGQFVTTSTAQTVSVPINKEEETMYTETQEQRNYLKNRLAYIFSNKEVEMNVFYGLAWETGPNSLKEFVARIQSGKFVICEEDTDYPYQCEWVHSFIWKDPNKPADKEGFAAAMALMTAAYTDAKDSISVKSPEQGLEALKAFEAKTFH